MRCNKSILDVSESIIKVNIIFVRDYTRRRILPNKIQWTRYWFVRFLRNNYLLKIDVVWELNMVAYLPWHYYLLFSTFDTISLGFRTQRVKRDAVTKTTLSDCLSPTYILLYLNHWYSTDN